MTLTELKAFAELVRAVAADRAAVSQLVLDTSRKYPAGTEVSRLLQRFSQAADVNAVIAICDDVKQRTDDQGV